MRGRAEDEDTRAKQPGAERSSKMALRQTKATTGNCIRPKNKRILHCFALNTELQRILNDEPTEEEKKQHEILKAARDEQKAVDDEHFAITFIPDSSEASRVRATLIQEQRKDPFLSMIIDKLLTESRATRVHLPQATKSLPIRRRTRR